MVERQFYTLVAGVRFPYLLRYRTAAPQRDRNRRGVRPLRGKWFVGLHGEDARLSIEK